MAKIAVIGTGYVGLVSGALLSDFGHSVICVDLDQDKIAALNKGVIPIYEPGLSDIVEKNLYYKRLSFTTDARAAVEAGEMIFIAVGTPTDEDGSADLQYVFRAAEEIASYMNEYKVIVDKSTVPVGTGQRVKELVRSILAERKADYPFDVVSNPEFLREGSAVNDFLRPDRVVIGAESETAFAKMKDIYRVLYLNETPFIETNLETAEMIKYASNAFLAMKITYINEIANLCEKVGADVQQVARAMGRDGRISPKFLHAGPGYGGSCFPKDTQALANIAREREARVTLVEATIQANQAQKLAMVKKIIGGLGGSVEGKTLAVLGLTFKPNTDDMREAPSLTIVPKLIEAGAQIQAFDPEGEKEGVWRLSEAGTGLSFCSDEYEAISGSDAVVILTEWNQFRNLDFDRIREISRGRVLFDLRNVYERAQVEEQGFSYFCVGR
jgi:UDPglucose 6-dehydrogenase